MHEERIPLNGTFELTARCNLKCKMCLVRVDEDTISSLGLRELTTKEWIDLAKQARDCGTLQLLLTGGEPMLRKDFCEIYTEIYKMGFVIVLYTNATLVSDKVMDALEKCPPHQIGISVYGSNPSIYDKVCGSGNAFYRMLDGVKKLTTLPSSINIRTTIIKDNIEDYKNIYMLAKSFGEDITFSRSRIVCRTTRHGIADVDACRLSPEENIDFIYGAYLERLSKDLIDKPIEIEYTVEEKKSELFGCDAGIQSYTITWDGKLIGCQLLGEFMTDPLSEGFEKVWETFVETVPELKQIDACRDCKYKLFCMACPALRYCETKSLFGNPKYLCREAEYSHKILEKLISTKGSEIYENV